ncbi:protein preY, mitochondrial [Spea bombifrons]|uniref:protein preY, mitochondrial n=1 Tax=Spea bombifrons TaxID=233779 RepID=UPI00234A0C04|nr:protein preY, mitochondrial [Spea bombifrons]
MLGLGVCRAVCESLARWPVSVACRSSPAVRLQSLHVSVTHPSAKQEHKDSAPIDPALLQVLVCPLSRKPLRFEAATNELINDELGIAYPIVDGIPNMTPQDARMIHKDQKPEDTGSTS